jgi:hypothetical protein
MYQSRPQNGAFQQPQRQFGNYPRNNYNGAQTANSTSPGDINNNNSANGKKFYNNSNPKFQQNGSQVPPAGNQER